MTKEEKTLLNKLQSMEFEEYETELDILLETYDFNNCSEDFDAEFRNLMGKKYLKGISFNNIPFEESIQKMFDSYTEQERQAYLNEDWSEFDDV